MFKRFLGLAFLFCSFVSPLSAKMVQYAIGFSEPQAHYTDVEMMIGGEGDSTDFKMPVWIPGSYMVREFSRMVEAFDATDYNGNSLRWNKVSKNTWRVYHRGIGKVRVSYRVYCFELSVRTSFVDHDRALINGATVFMYTERTRNDSCRLAIGPVPHWKKISTGMEPEGRDPFVRVAENFDRLIDSPIFMGNHTVFSFESAGVVHEVAMTGKAEFDSITIQNDLKRITTECTRIFGSNPVKRYVFLVINAPTAGGGLEHANSTVLQVNAQAYNQPGLYNGFLSLCAHEYFHLWLGKRIRDEKLGPFDYDHEVYTTQLWLYEGFTSFYDDFILYRTGIYPESEYLDILKGNITSVVNAPGNKYQSLTESSFDAWIKYYRRHENSNNSTISYYTKGGMVAAILNLDLISRTGGVKSLDDLMVFLYNRFLQNGKGLSDEEVLEAFEAVWGTPMKDFFSKYISGTEDLPFEEYLLKAGIRMVRTDGHIQKPGYLGAVFPDAPPLVISGVVRGSPAWADGLNVNDEILRADTASAGSVKPYLQSKLPGNEVVFRVRRLGEEREIMVTLGEDPAAAFIFEKINKPDAMQKKIYKKWMEAGISGKRK